MMAVKDTAQAVIANDDGDKKLTTSNGTNSNEHDNNNKISTPNLMNHLPGPISPDEWPYDRESLYKISLQFFKGNEGKAFHPSYDQRNMLIAYTLQEKHGAFNPEKAIPLGTFDLVGHDRRNAWISLKDMPKAEAMELFIKTIDELCPFFRSYLIAVKCDQEEKERKRLEMEELERQKQKEMEMSEQRKQEEEERNRAEEKRKRFEKQKRMIQEILNRQTYNQFSNYARQQYPDSPELQEQLLKQLQEQHFEQYIQQMIEQSPNGELMFQDNPNDDDTPPELTENMQRLAVNNGDQSNHHDQVDESVHQNADVFEDEDEEEDDEEESEASRQESKQIQTASMWTRKDIHAFKESVRAEGGHGIIKIGHGEVATIRVPTHDNGSCIFWEFATDDYDIGFGLFFEWNSTPDSQVSVCFSDSEEDEEEEIDAAGDISATAHDIEKGTNRVLTTVKPSLANTDGAGGQLSPETSARRQHPAITTILPIYRRDSCEEVFAGSHIYPGKGVYLLKFDNSYSLWRSKTLYYRVYYTKEP